MKARAARTQVTKSVARTGSPRAALRKIAKRRRPNVHEHVQRAIHRKPEPARKSTQSQTHHPKKGTTQSPEKAHDRYVERLYGLKPRRKA